MIVSIGNQNKSPYHLLALSVIHLAVRDLSSGKHSQAAVDFIHSLDFDTWCAWADIDPNATRAYLAQHTRQHDMESIDTNNFKLSVSIN